MTFLVQKYGAAVDSREEHTVLLIFYFQVLRATFTNDNSATSRPRVVEPTLALGATQGEPLPEGISPLFLDDLFQLSLKVMLELQVPRMRVQPVEYVFLGVLLRRGFLRGGRYLGSITFL